MSKIIAEIKEVSKVYKNGDTETIALAKSSLQFRTNELTIILGPSGSGKTTLLSLLGCVIYPSSGKVIINGQDVTHLSEKKLAAIRLNNIGFVFQGFNLIQPLSALENVMSPLLLKGISRKSAAQKAKEALKQVDMSDRMYHLPKMLSGGQKQRVAIARSLVTEPPILLCDEPTASIDSKNAYKIMTELKELSTLGKAVLIVTHDTRLCKYADRIVYLSEGKTSEEPFKENEYEL
ncbi:MAG: ABC transporter ATP-binding protein [Chitinophagales bacterium]|nr:ABC transporter ATP-binding protein [Chitinophagales bacterium]